MPRLGRAWISGARREPILPTITRCGAAVARCPQLVIRSSLFGCPWPGPLGAFRGQGSPSPGSEPASALYAPFSVVTAFGALNCDPCASDVAAHTGVSWLPRARRLDILGLFAVDEVAPAGPPAHREGLPHVPYRHMPIGRRVIAACALSARRCTGAGATVAGLDARGIRSGRNRRLACRNAAVRANPAALPGNDGARGSAPAGSRRGIKPGAHPGAPRCTRPVPRGRNRLPASTRCVPRNAGPPMPRAPG